MKSLTPRWLFQHGVIDGVSNQTTPIIVDGSDVCDRFARQRVCGRCRRRPSPLDLRRDEPLGGGSREGYVFRNRGAVYANGVVYTAGGSFLFALDAKTGTPLQGFGKGGQASVIMDVLTPRYPGSEDGHQHGLLVHHGAAVLQPDALYRQHSQRESHSRRSRAGRRCERPARSSWHFNTVPQDEKDQGWAVAGPTWVGGERNGGGIWETAAIDPQLGLIYMAVGNPFGDSTKRAGTNLFSDSIIALSLDTGQLKWYFQETHHDVWDYDSGGPPTLFDMQVGGKPCERSPHASKNGYLYILNRETGQPVHPIKEMPVPTTPARPGEQPWPTQPIPFTASGKLDGAGVPDRSAGDPARAAGQEQDRAAVHTEQPEPDPGAGTGGGASYSPISYSPQTGLLYVAAIDSPTNPGRGPKGYFSAYNPTTGELRVAADFRRLRTSRLSGHRRRSDLRRRRQQPRRIFLRV